MKSGNRPSRLRRWWWPAAGSLLAGLVAGGWLVGRMQPDFGQFEARRATLVSYAAETPRPETGGFVSQAVRVTGDNGLQVDLRVLRATEAKEPRPLVVLLGGHRTGRDAVDLLGAPGPFVVAALDYPYAGPERPRGVRQSLAAIWHGRAAFRETPAAVWLALDWLLAQPEVDPTRVELIGVSLGVPFATLAGALEPRFRRVWLIHGGAGNREWMEHNLESRVASEIWRRRAGGLLHWLAHGAALEPAHWVPLISPRPVVVIGAREDRRLPAHLVEKLHAAAGEPKELIWTDGGHVDRRPEAVRALLETVRSRLAEN
jgi:dienelactone hydrolase